MAGGPDNPPVPEPAEGKAPRIGVDEWVASVEERRDRGKGVVGYLRGEFARVPRPAPHWIAPCFSGSTRFAITAAPS